MADEFSYDNAGNRIKREYIYTIISPKQGRPVDTLVQQFRKEELTVRAYPNPVANEMIVENLSWKEGYKATVSINDITGKLLQTKSFNAAKEQFSLANLVPGTYTVQYYLNGKILTTWKIVKK
jgi:hypothetical protein